MIPLSLIRVLKERFDLIWMQCHGDVKSSLDIYVLIHRMKETIYKHFCIVLNNFCASSACCTLQTGSEHFKDKKQEEEHFQYFRGCSLGERFFLFIPEIEEIAAMCQGRL